MMPILFSLLASYLRNVCGSIILEPHSGIYQSCFCPIALGVVGKKRAMGFSQAFDRVSNCGEMANVRVGEENADTSMGSSKN